MPGNTPGIDPQAAGSLPTSELPAQARKKTMSVMVRSKPSATGQYASTGTRLCRNLMSLTFAGEASRIAFKTTKMMIPYQDDGNRLDVAEALRVNTGAYLVVFQDDREKETTRAGEHPRGTQLEAALQARRPS